MLPKRPSRLGTPIPFPASRSRRCLWRLSCQAPQYTQIPSYTYVYAGGCHCSNGSYNGQHTTTMKENNTSSSSSNVTNEQQQSAHGIPDNSANKH